VRVETEAEGHTQHYGKSGFVVGIQGEPDEPQVTFFSDNGSTTVPLELITQRREREIQGRHYYAFGHSGFNTKTMMLHQLGYWRWSEAEPIETVTNKHPPMLEGHHLRLWDLVLSSTFAKSGCHLVDPVSVLHTIFQDEDVSEERKNYLVSGIMNAFKQRHVHKLLVPIHCPEMPEHLLGHWTLLVIEKLPDKPLTMPSVRYYETMAEDNEICFSKALRMLTLLGIPSEAETMQRTNVALQSGAECTEQVMYYMELEYRHQMMEGWGTIKCFRAHRPTIRTQLSRFSKNLEAHRLVWLQKEKENELKEKILKSQLEDMAGKAMVAQIEIDKLRKMVEAVAQFNTEDHLGLPDIALPEAKPKAKAKSKPKAKPKPKAKAAAAVSEPVVSEPEAGKPLEPEPAEPEPAGVQPGEPEPEAVQPVEPADQVVLLDDPEIEAKLEELQALEGKLDKWLKTVSVDQKESLCKRLYETREGWSEMKAYHTFVKQSETFKVCSKCRMQSGCEKCDSEKTLNYLLRHGQVPPWFRLYHGKR
jgi:hypothetical protein